MAKPSPSSLTPVERGLWPRDQETNQRTVTVTIELGRDKWEWLAAALGSPDELGHSELWNVEGVIDNAIRYMRDDPGYLASLALELKQMAGDELDAEDRSLARFLERRRATLGEGDVEAF